MSDASRKTPTTGQTPKASTPRATSSPARAQTSPASEKPRPKPAMRSDERLIGRSIIGSGAPHKR